MSKQLLEQIYIALLSKLGLAIFGLALIIDVGAFFFVEYADRQLSAAQSTEAHSSSVISKIEQINTLLVETESAQRGYLYTGKSLYLNVISQKEAAIKQQLQILKTLVSDNSSQHDLASNIQRIAQEKINEIKKTVTLFQARQPTAAWEIVTVDSNRFMEHFGKTYQNFVTEENKLKLTREEHSNRVKQGMRYGFILILLCNAGLLLFGMYTVSNAIEKKTKTTLRAIKAGEKLEAEVKLRTQELRELSVHLQHLQEEERKLIARELHDELGGTLAAVKMDISMSLDVLRRVGEEKSAIRLEKTLEAINNAIRFKRKMIEDLRPTLLDNLGFAAAVRWQCEQFSERAGCPCHVHFPEEEFSLPPAQAIALYRVLQESMTNILKYAKASQIHIKMSRDNTHWKLSIEDNGIGFDSNKKHHITPHGLVGMRERMAALGGSFTISGTSGLGTTVVALVPIATTSGS